MDMQTLVAAIGVMKGMPDNAASSAAAAADSAEAAAASAQTAQQHSMGFAFADGILTLEPATGGN